MRRFDPRGEMPFLDHLEELRWRILWSLAALLVGTVAGFWAVQHFDIIGLLKPFKCRRYLARSVLNRLKEW